MTLRPSRPSPAMLVAILALVVAMSGSAVAVSAARHSGDTLISKRSLSGNRLRHNTVTGKEVSEQKLGQVPRASLATHVPPLVWHNFTLMYDWTNYNAPRRVPGYAVDVQGVVHLRGEIANGTLYLFTQLPAAVRPTEDLAVPAAMDDGLSNGSVVIQSNGNVSVFKTDVNMVPGHANLDGVTYSVD